MRIVRHISDLPRDGDRRPRPHHGRTACRAHPALFRAARPECDVLVASLFVNPAQFSERSDLAAYPRDSERDRALAEAEGIDVLFAPSPEEMYPPGFATWVDPAGVAVGLESGTTRPGHFRGVATVCLKLLNIVRPHIRLVRPEGRAAGRPSSSSSSAT